MGWEQPRQPSAGRAARVSAEQSQGTATPQCGHSLPVIVHELAAFDVWHGDNTAALVLAIPDGAGNLQHSQDSAIPAQGNRTSVPPRNIGICLTGPLRSACHDPSPCRLAQLLAVQRSKNYSSCSLVFTKKKLITAASPVKFTLQSSGSSLEC